RQELRDLVGQEVRLGTGTERALLDRLVVGVGVVDDLDLDSQFLTLKILDLRQVDLALTELDAESLVELEEQEVDRTLRLPRLGRPMLHVVDRCEEPAVRTLLPVRDAQVQSRTRGAVVRRSRVLDRGRRSLDHRDVVATSVERLVVAPGRSGLLLSTLGD